MHRPHEIEISWDAVPDAAGYKIYRSTTSGGPFNYPSTSSSTSYTDFGESNTTHYYKVSAYNSNNEEGTQSSPVSATTIVSTPWLSPVSAISPTSIEISWDTVPGANGYYVYRAESETGPYDSITSITSTSYTDTSLSPGTTCYYKVSAYNSSNNRSSLSTIDDYLYRSYAIASIPLEPSDEWYTNTLAPEEVHYYSCFYGSGGYQFRIYWDDYDSTNTYANIKVSVSNSSENLLSDIDGGYSGHSFDVRSSGYILITVQGFDASSSGEYKIKRN
ncbi:MAG: hypothetical protein LBP76_00980 [Treponema sp.]|nr:hypothetical protein [Treponema sp.]